MNLCYRLTCNPWSDRGAVIVAERLEANSGLIEQVEVSAGEIVVRFHASATREQVQAALADLLRERQDGLFVPNSLARSLTKMGRRVPQTDAEGRRSADVTVTVGAGDVPELKKNGVATAKAGEAKVYRLAASYPGMPGDLRGVMDKADVLAEQVVEEMADAPPNRAGVCAMSDAVTKHLEALTQSLHIFANKHHNAAVRGFGSGNGYFRAGAAWRYALALSATEPYHPFFEARNQGTTLLLPVVDDFPFLRRLHRHFKQTGALNDISLFESPTSATNIRDLYRGDLYSGLVSLLHCLRNPLTVTEQTDDYINPTEIVRLTHWMTGQFKRGTYVSFGTFHVIEANPNLFRLVEPLVYERKEKDLVSYQVVPHVFNRMKWPDTGVAGRFSRALVESSSPAMKAALWEMYKEHDGFSFYNKKGEPGVLRLFNAFLNHFMEVNHAHMNPEIRSAAKDMGKLVGRAFPRDLTLLSRIYNIHDAGELRDAMKMVLFRLEKAGVEQARRAKVPDEERLYPVKNRPFEVLLDGIDDQNFREIADVFSIFASLNAFNANVGGKPEGTDDNAPGAPSTGDGPDEGE